MNNGVRSLFRKGVVTQLLVLFGVIVLSAQKGGDRADALFKKGEYTKALPYYSDQYHGSSPPSPKISYRFGVCAFQDPAMLDKAIEALEAAADPSYRDSKSWLGRAYHRKGRFQQAIDAYHDHLMEAKKSGERQEVDRYVQMAIRAQVMMDDPVKVHSSSLRVQGNSDKGLGLGGDVFAQSPMVTANGKELFLEIGGSEEPGKGSRILHYRIHEKSGSISVIDTLPYRDEWRGFGLAGISSNGNMLILRKVDPDHRTYDLYFSSLNENGDWSAPTSFGPSVNTDKNEAKGWMTPDERLMFFSSERNSGYGGKDIYVVKKLPTGDWSKARNLGPAINTRFNESSPFLLPDAKTVYFLSEGHNTMGGTDIFKTYLDTDLNRWIIPENPGYPVNSVYDEKSFSMTGDGKVAYLERFFREDQKCGVKRFRLLYDDAHLTVLHGKVIEKGEEKPIKAKITLVNPNKRKVKGIYRTNSKNGGFIMILTPEVQYKMIVEADGYAPYTDKVRVPIGNKEERNERTIELKPE